MMTPEAVHTVAKSRPQPATALKCFGEFMLLVAIDLPFSASSIHSRPSDEGELLFGPTHSRPMLPDRDEGVKGQLIAVS